MPGGRDVYPCVGRGGLAVQGLRRRLQGPDSAVHRADRAAGAVLRGRLPGLALQAVRHRRRPGPDAASSSRASWPRASPTSGSTSAASCCTSSTRSSTPCPAIRSWPPLTQAEKQAYDLILGDAGKVFDLTQEKDELRDRYGRNTFGQSCLVARRLVERGVPYVTINYKGWDTHKQHFQTMRRKLPELDKGLATLLQDLSDRGLLDSTIVWCCGEFGRTPKVQWEPPWNGGRGHYGKVFSALVAGGGFKGGHVVGRVRRQGRRGQGPARLSRATSSAACTSCWASTPTPSCRIRRARRSASCPRRKKAYPAPANSGKSCNKEPWQGGTPCHRRAKKKKEEEPRMDTDETRINSLSSSVKIRSVGLNRFGVANERYRTSKA